MRIAKAFWRSTTGATSIEYALIGVFISIVIVAGVTTIGTRLNTKFVSPVANGLS